MFMSLLLELTFIKKTRWLISFGPRSTQLNSQALYPVTGDGPSFKINLKK